MTQSTSIDQHNNLTTADGLLARLVALRHDVAEDAAALLNQWDVRLNDDRAYFADSLSNLAAYVALRRRDLRDLQDALRPWGLSSLGRIEAQVLPNLDAVIATLAQIAGHEDIEPPQRPTLNDFMSGQRLLEAESNRLFNPPPQNRQVRMMVTLPSEAANDPALVLSMVEHGMNIARINCAHDTAADWQRMIDHVRTAEEATGKQIKIAMDLGGPKSRTMGILSNQKRVFKGDTILLTGDMPSPHPDYNIQVGCSLHEALAQAQIGQRVWFDDGKIGTEIVQRVPQGIVLTITHARDKGDTLKDDKGINFPDTELILNPLTAKDLADLDFVVHHADIINYSFVQTPDDVRLLQHEIQMRQPATPPALIAKIETAKAIKYLPGIIAAAGSQQPVGVMIARGDLAVEIGFERMAEMQEEILWICEAAHIPVVWATQVLESLAKKGRPSRAEVTDAAMAERAECVMLNKGPYILDAMTILDNILARMSAHQSKKVARLRALRSW